MVFFNIYFSFKLQSDGLISKSIPIILKKNDKLIENDWNNQISKHCSFPFPENKLILRTLVIMFRISANNYNFQRFISAFDKKMHFTYFFNSYTGHTNCLNIVVVYVILSILRQLWWLNKFLKINCKCKCKKTPHIMRIKL